MTCEEIGQKPVYKKAVLSVGDDWSFQLNFAVAGEVYDLTGSTITSVITKDGETDIDLDVSVVEETGVCVITLTEAQTATITGGTDEGDIEAWWQLHVWFTDPTGYKRRIILGDVFILA